MDIREAPVFTRALTIKDMKEILSHLPDEDGEGRPCFVWIAQVDGKTKDAKSIWALNKNGNSCDVLIDPHG